MLRFQISVFSWVFCGLLPLLLKGGAASPTEAEHIGSSPLIRSPFTNPLPNVCPVLQDGSTSDTFPWTHPPTCLPLVLPSLDDSHTGTHRTFCVYTNTEFNNGRGISIIAAPETAAELSNEVYEAAVGRTREQSGQWEARKTKGKGLGLFAKKEIEAGETLSLESPVVIVSQEALSSVSHSRRKTLLEKAVEQLSETTREMVMNLSRRGGDGEVEDIINVNAIRAKVWDGTSHLLVIPEAARINHACRPNAYYRFDDHTLSLTVFALRPIPPGQELTFSYGFSFQPHSVRQAALKETWGFTCTCPLCNSNSTAIAASDARVSTIAAMKSSLPTSLDDIPQYIALLPKLISLMDEEDLLIELPMYEEILAYAWSAVKEEGRAKAWAERASWHWGVIAGKESWESRRTKQLADGVKEHYTWGSWKGGDIWEGVGQGHPWDEREGDDHHHDHDHDHGH